MYAGRRGSDGSNARDDHGADGQRADPGGRPADALDGERVGQGPAAGPAADLPAARRGLARPAAVCDEERAKRRQMMST